MLKSTPPILIFLHTDFNSVGGIETAARMLHESIDKNELQIHFVSRDFIADNHSAIQKKIGVTLLHHKTASWSSARKSEISKQIFLLPLVLMQKLKDLILCSYRFRKIYLETGKPRIIIQHQQVFIIALLSFIPRNKRIFALHRNPEGYVKSKFNYRYVLFCLKHSHMCIALTQIDAKYWVSKGFNCRVIPNLLPLNKVTKYEKKKIVIWVGRMVEGKNIQKAVGVFHNATVNNLDWILYFLGDGPEKIKAEMEAKKLNIADRVRFVGETDPQSYFEEASILISTSSNEGFGLSIFEAISFKVVPIVMEFGNNIFELLDFHTKFISEKNNFEYMTELLKHLIENEKYLEKIRNDLNNKSNWQQVIESWKSLASSN